MAFHQLPCGSTFSRIIRTFSRLAPPAALHTRKLQTIRVPSSAPTSFASFLTRLPSPNLRRFSQTEVGVNPSHGKFVDIHDIGPTSPEDFDVLITDVNERTLHEEISDRLGIKYLSEPTKDVDSAPNFFPGFIWGRKYRSIAPMIIKNRSKARWVFFIHDTGSPLSYISEEVAKEFGFRIDDSPWNVEFFGRKHPVSVVSPESRFTGINLLGAEFCFVHRLRPWMDDEGRGMKYYFDKKWDVDSKLT